MRRHVPWLLVFLLVPWLALGQSAPPAQPPDRARVLDAARHVMVKAGPCVFITNGLDGQPQARIVEPSAPDERFAVWVLTKASSRKVEQIRRDARVTLSFFDP